MRAGLRCGAAIPPLSKQQLHSTVVGNTGELALGVQYVMWCSNCRGGSMIKPCFNTTRGSKPKRVCIPRTHPKPPQ